MRSTIGITAAEWDLISNLILAQFILVDGTYFHPKLLAQRKKYLAYSKKQTANAKKGADARWHAKGNAEAMLDDASSYCKLDTPGSSLQSSVNEPVTTSNRGSESANQSASQRQGKGQSGTPSLDPGTGHKQDILDRDLVEFWARNKSNWWYKKGREKIDGCVAQIMAFARATDPSNAVQESAFQIFFPSEE
jgi:hypothetical protein